MITTQNTPAALSETDRLFFEEKGYLIVRGLLSPAEAKQLAGHFMDIHASAPIKGFYEPLPLDQCNGDILKAYPRIMHPHRFDARSMQYMLDPRIGGVLRDLLGEEPLAAQSMLYFKPPKALGQAMHQDNFYLKVKPGNCIAAWVALDPADEENGGLKVVPGSHKLPVLCPGEADLSQSFVNHQVAIPKGMPEVPAILAAGDVLFFGGSVIHGSSPNRSAERWRRSFICHYVPQSQCDEIGKWYHPLYTFDRFPTLVKVAPDDAGPCGGPEGNEAH